MRDGQHLRRLVYEVGAKRTPIAVAARPGLVTLQLWRHGRFIDIPMTPAEADRLATGLDTMGREARGGTR